MQGVQQIPGHQHGGRGREVEAAAPRHSASCDRVWQCGSSEGLASHHPVHLGLPAQDHGDGALVLRPSLAIHGTSQVTHLLICLVKM